MINGPITIPAGHNFKLTADQLRRRQTIMQKKRGSVYESTEATQWKTGEEIETDFVIAKGMENRVIDTKEPPPPRIESELPTFGLESDSSDDESTDQDQDQIKQ